jgi:hypothetical protein
VQAGEEVVVSVMVHRSRLSSERQRRRHQLTVHRSRSSLLGLCGCGGGGRVGGSWWARARAHCLCAVSQSESCAAGVSMCEIGFTLSTVVSFSLS